MTDAPQFPPGWYADPDDPTVHRWWNGSAWTEARQPSPQTAPAPPAPQAAPSPQAAPAPQAVPAYQAPHVPPAAQAAYPAYPSYPAAPVATAAPVRRDIPIETPWIWLIVFLPLVSIIPLFFIDWREYLQSSIDSSLQSPSTAWVASFTGATLVLTLLGYLVIAAQVVFAFLDWRALRARGIDRPFHWAWIFFTLIISNGVYVIGRGIILRRQTGKGLAPVWAWIAVTVLTLAIGMGYAVYIFSEVFSLISTYDTSLRS
jgi:hypothetical protein